MVCGHSGSLLRVSSRAAQVKSVVRSADLYQSDDQEISGARLVECLLPAELRGVR